MAQLGIPDQRQIYYTNKPIAFIIKVVKAYKA